jgi:VCBS repeat-containing protein
VATPNNSNPKTVTPKVTAVDNQSNATEAGISAGSNGTGNALANDSATSGALAVSGIRVGGTSTSGVAGTVGVALKGLYGSLTINSNGTYTYVVDNSNITVNALAKGESLQELFTYTATNGQASASAAIVINVNGANDAATITGQATGAVIEDGATATATGQLTVNDVDHGENQAKVINNQSGEYGKFSITANGAWTYVLNKNAENVQALAAGETVTDSFVVTSKDGTATQTVVVTVTGTNDVATINGDTRASLTEDSAHTVARGELEVHDRDHGESAARVVTNQAGTYGVFSVDAGGHWTFVMDNSLAAVQALAQGEKGTDSFVVWSKDGSASQTVTVTVNGVNDVATITGTATGSVNEDASPNTATGKLNVNDVDHGENTVVPVTAKAGSYGSFSITADGSWTYTVNNSLTAVQALAEGSTLTESFVVYSKDSQLARVKDEEGGDGYEDEGDHHDTSYHGASKVVTVTIVGTNDVAVITGNSTGAVTEDITLGASGQLNVSDVDAGQSSFQAQSATAGTYGSFSIDATGSWAYSLNNTGANVQALAANEVATETFTVKSFDGTQKVVTLTITGTNDIAHISGSSSGAVTEDTTLSASGTLTVADVDHGQAVFQAQANAAGTYGSFNIGADGNWTYALNNDAANVQSLNTADHLSDSFTVFSQDGSASQVVTVNVNGLDDIHNLSPVAVDDLATGSAQVAAGLTFEEGTYTQNWGQYNYSTGQYQYTVTTGDFVFTNGVNSSNNYGSGPYVTSYWGADYTNAIYSYGYNYSYYYGYGNSTTTTTPIDMSKADGSVFALKSANITSYDYSYYYYGGGQTDHETITGYLHGVQVAQQSFDVPNANYGSHNNVVTLTDPGFSAVDNVEFSLTNNGYNNSYYYYYNYAYQWIDNVDVGGGGPTANSALDINVLANDSDPDVGDTLSVASFATTSAQGANITLNLDGTLHYDPTLLASMQALAAGETLTDNFTYRVQDQHGALSNSATVTVVVNGVNDAASISGVSTGVVTEDVTLQATGHLTVSDVDHGEAHVRAQSNVAGNYGSFSIGTDGNWAYTLNNDASNVQALSASQQVSDSFTVTSADGTATQQVLVNIAGTNDAPVATNDTIQGGFLTFENYSQSYYYDYNTGNYITSIDTDGFHFAAASQVNNGYGSGPWITSWWGADNTNAIYSYGYNYNYYNSTSTTTPIAMTKTDGSSFSMTSANITGYADYYNYGGSEVETVTGYLHGVQVAQQSFSVPDANYGTHNNVLTFTDPGFGSVDKVVFSLTNSSAYNNYYYYSNAYQWIDNIALPNTVAQARDVNVLANDSDIDNGAHLSVGSFALYSAHGAAISLNSDGTLHYDPTVSAELQALSQGTDVYDSFTYQAQDELGALSNTATVSIHVVGVAHA